MFLYSELYNTGMLLCNETKEFEYQLTNRAFRNIFNVFLYFRGSAHGGIEQKAHFSFNVCAKSLGQMELAKIFYKLAKIHFTVYKKRLG